MVKQHRPKRPVATAAQRAYDPVQCQLVLREVGEIGREYSRQLHKHALALTINPNTLNERPANDHPAKKSLEHCVADFGVASDLIRTLVLLVKHIDTPPAERPVLDHKPLYRMNGLEFEIAALQAEIADFGVHSVIARIARGFGIDTPPDELPDLAFVRAVRAAGQRPGPKLVRQPEENVGT